jgi:threonine synthase
MNSMKIVCSNCHEPYPQDSLPYLCKKCGAIYDVVSLDVYEKKTEFQKNPGIWRYKNLLNLPEDTPEISLGEGNTPLIFDRVNGYEVGFKLEFMNPTGSYKDRGSSVLVSQLVNFGVKSAVEDSSGNAGASFAAYAARAGIQARIFVPASTSGPKRKQIEAYGADIIPVDGPRTAASQAALEAVKQGAVYGSHAYLPCLIPGYATIAYEIFEQLGKAPGAVIAPIGQGNMLFSVAKGFSALMAAGLIDTYPRLIGVQAKACAPIWKSFLTGKNQNSAASVAEEPTLAEGVKVSNPVRGNAVIDMINYSMGTICVTEESQILPGLYALARRGFYVEPTTAIVWDALLQMLGKFPEPIVVLLTGSGLKYNYSNH